MPLSVNVIPGLFAVNGDYSDKKEFATKFMKEMIIYRNAQNNWFKNAQDD